MMKKGYIDDIDTKGDASRTYSINILIAYPSIHLSKQHRFIKPKSSYTAPSIPRFNCLFIQFPQPCIYSERRYLLYPTLLVFSLVSLFEALAFIFIAYFKITPRKFVYLVIENFYLLQISIIQSLTINQSKVLHT